MFISVLELFKIGIGPSSSHTLGPMVAANDFIGRIKNQEFGPASLKDAFIRCTLKGSLAYTGKGHSTDRAVALGLHGYLPASLTDVDVEKLVHQVWKSDHIEVGKGLCISFTADVHIVFDKGEPLAGMTAVAAFDACIECSFELAEVFRFDRIIKLTHSFAPAD